MLYIFYIENENKPVKTLAIIYHQI